MICANSSPRMSCSVKFFEPTTMRSAFRSQAITGKRSSKTRSVQMIFAERPRIESIVNLMFISDVYLRCLSLCSKLRFRTQRSESPLQSSEHKVGEERQQRRRNGSRQ